MGLNGATVGLDTRDLHARAGTGIATYARGVADAVARHGGRVELLGAGPALPRAARGLRAVRAGLFGLDLDRPAPDLFRLAQMHFDLWRRPVEGRMRRPPAVMHWTSPLPVRLAGAPNLVTVHDLIPLRTPNLTATDPRRHRRLLSAVLGRADHVLAVSAATGAELLAAFPQVADRLSVLPQAVRLPPAVCEADPGAVDAVARRHLGCPAGGYWIAPGTVEPRKNIPRLIEAHRRSGSARPLCLVGPDGWRAAAELAPHLDRIGPPGSGRPVIRLQHLDRVLLLSLLRGARALLFPSLAEGFGLPILEAMGLGVPAVTSQGGATGEVAGDAALLVAPENGAALAEAIAALDRDNTLCARLADGGRMRAALFSFDRYAAQLAALYEVVRRSWRGR